MENRLDKNGRTVILRPIRLILTIIERAGAFLGIHLNWGTTLRNDSLNRIKWVVTMTKIRAIHLTSLGTTVLGVSGWFLAGDASVVAAPIKSLHVPDQHLSEEIQTFDAYLKGGPGHWQAGPLMKIPSGVHLRSSDGQLKTDRAVGYALWVRDRHPIQFDRNHPALGRLLESAQSERGTEYFVSTPKSDRAARVESIHALSRSTTALEAQVLAPVDTPQIFPSARRSTLEPSGASQAILPARAAVLEAQQLAPPTPAAPEAASVNSQLAQEISSASVVSTNVQAIPEILRPTETPEPASVLTTLLLFGSAASWKGWKNRALRSTRSGLSW
jgi:hypothetical protein